MDSLSDWIDLKAQLAAAVEKATRCERELCAERLYRQEVESKLCVLNINTDQRVRACVEQHQQLEQRVGRLDERHREEATRLRSELATAVSQLHSLRCDLDETNRRYLRLLGLNQRKASELQRSSAAEPLPSSVDELRAMVMKLREQLIETRAAYEHSIYEWVSLNAGRGDGTTTTQEGTMGESVF